ncbi:hypothetical protein Ocin01_03587 [Orchesella cincta]|uniref:Ricin B lectin domain-containing protein n=1 Tax=Orchesella cincta TaxID=48709 RepID=A0A1D2NCW8_ORCCI|nr:hypothetical protein Ocin01_03587 [Orchesella cincta]
MTRNHIWAKNSASRCAVVLILISIWSVSNTNAGMDEFLRDAMYSIQSASDRGYLTLRESPMNTYKIIQPEPWGNEKSQKWMVFDFQSIGLYDFTPVMFNTTDNMVTYEASKNVYTFKRQWKVTLVTVDKYQIRNPESTLCLTNIGSYKEVTEKTCHPRLPLNQLWKFRMHKQ